MQNIQCLNCPKCGGSDFEQLSDGKLACKYCGSISIVLQGTEKLELQGWRCPSCRTINPVSSRFCGKCGVRITKHCPKCSQDVPHYTNYCTNCSYRFLPGEITVLECVAGVGGLAFANRITLTNRRLCCASDNCLCSGYFEVLLTDIEKLKINDSYRLMFRNRKGSNMIRLYFNEPSELPGKLVSLLKE